MRSRVRRLSALAAAVCLVGAFAACSSTVQIGRGATVAGTSELGGEDSSLGLSPDDAGAESGAGRSRSSSGSAGGSGAVDAGAGGDFGDGGSASSMAPTARTARAPGVTRTHIYVGAPVLESGAEAHRALGNEGITTGDQRRQYDILFADLNKRGGIAGRRAVPIYHKIDALSRQTAEQQAQATCATFTQDNKVFAALGGLNDTFLECMTKAGTVQVLSELTNSSKARFARFPRYVEVSSPTLDRQAAVWPAQLKAGRYFTKGAKVGVITFDTPHFVRALDRVLAPELRRVGFPMSERYLVRPASSFSDNGNVAASIQNAVLQFNSRGVTHVLIFDERAFITVFFMRGAEQQRYNPRYGFNTQNGIGYLLETDQIPESQLTGAVGVGWSPVIGIATPQDPVSKRSAQRKRCIGLMNAGGINYEDRNAEAIALQQCDMVWFLETAIELGGPISAANFMTNVSRLGSRYLSTVNFANRFVPGVRDGTAALRRLAYFDNCSCVNYTSGVIGF